MGISRAIGTGVGLLCLAVVVLSGWQARRRAKAAAALAGVEGTEGTEGTEGGTELGAEQGAGEGGGKLPGTKRMLLGGAALLFALAGLVQASAQNASEDRASDKLRLQLPPTLLSLPHNDDAFPGAVARTKASLPTEKATETVAGFYGSRIGGVSVVAVRGADLGDDLSAALDGVFDGFGRRRDVRLGTPADVAGDPAVSLRCASITSTATSASAGFLCALATPRTLVVVTDPLATTQAEAAQRARTVRSQVVVAKTAPQPTAQPTPPPTTSPAAPPAVTVALPRSIAGAALDRSKFAQERAAFLKSTRNFLDQADIGLYDGAGRTFLVETGAGDVTPGPLFLRQYESNLRSQFGTGFGARVTVPAGPLGGSGYCWKVVDGGSTTYFCLLVDDRAYVSLYDLRATSLARTAELARQARALVERRAS